MKAKEKFEDGWIDAEEYSSLLEKELKEARVKIKKTTEWIEWFTEGLKKQETYGQKTAIELYSMLTPPTQR